jgi:uncharacterized protein YndB with AHSA1/START domain
MNNDLQIETSIDINASKDEVWDALTNPAKIKEYLFGTNTTTDWKVGSDLFFEGEYQGKHYRDEGKILTNIPNEQLSYTYWSGFTGLENKPGNYSEVTFNLSGDNPVRLTLQQRKFVNEKARDHSKENWEKVLKQIKEICER